MAAVNRKINLMNDVLFKFVFGSDERKHITIDFINSMLEREGNDEVKDIAFKNAELTPLTADVKLSRLDVYCTLNSGEQLDIEIQVVNHHNMGERSLYYWAQMYLRSLMRGEDYNKLAPAIGINLLNYEFLP